MIAAAAPNPFCMQRHAEVPRGDCIGHHVADASDAASAVIVLGELLERDTEFRDDIENGQVPDAQPFSQWTRNGLVTALRICAMSICAHLESVERLRERRRQD